MKELKMLFSPIKIGTMELKNRCVMPPMGINYANKDGSLNDREIAYYVARAKGGFGLIITENVAVALVGKGIPFETGLWEDSHIPGWERLAKEVHSCGAKLAAQLHFAGPKAQPESTPGARLLGPSPVSYAAARGITGKLDMPIAKEMTEEDIESAVEAFGEAARRARDAGCDAVHIHGAHGYLLASFMSPAENRRIDAYGGTVDGRIKLALDILKRIRSKVGRDFPIIWKMSVDEMIPGGRTLEETQLIVWLLENAGLDCIDLSRGSINGAIHYIVPPGTVPPATWITQHTWVVKQAVKIPVIAVGRIIDPFMGEFILESGKADLIAFGRASLSDADLPNKAAAGRFDDIRYCMGCNSCNDSMREGDHSLRCAINPELGREIEMLPLAKAKKPKKVLVAGGGPGGLEAARVAALRGHNVTLCEKSDRLGGQFWLGALPPGKQQLTHGLKWLAVQAKKAGVKIELGTEVTPALVDRVKPDAVIVATGGVPRIPADIPGMDRAKVVTAHDVLLEKVRCGPTVVVLGANLIGCETADWLGFRRKNVILVKMRPGTEIGEDINIFVRPYVLDRLEQWKVKVVTGPKSGVKIKEVTGEGVIITRDGKEETIIADSVVLALGINPVNRLAEQLKGKVPELHLIGDAKEPRKVINAVYEGSVAARRI